MNQCLRCQGFLPPSVRLCPNCRSTRAWWALPLTIVGAGIASVTLSACYGTACAGKLPDGGPECGSSYGDFDAGTADAGTQDAGTTDSGT